MLVKNGFCGVMAWVVLATVCLAVGQPELKQWTVDGVAREGLVYIPAGASSSPRPVVFAFHGHGGNMTQASRSFNYHTLWPEAISVYLQGLKTPGKLTDPEGKRNGWQHGLGDQEDRDLKFFDAVLASLKSENQIDETRIYSTGHSNGGGFTYLLWGNRGDVFAAMAPSSAAAGSVAGAASLKPKPALHLAGKDDPLVKYEWQERMIERIQKLNGCSTTGTPWMTSGDLVGTLYPSTTGTPLVTLIHPGAHQFPAEAPKMIVKFFKEHAKAKSP